MTAKSELTELIDQTVKTAATALIIATTTAETNRRKLNRAVQTSMDTTLMA